MANSNAHDCLMAKDRRFVIMRKFSTDRVALTGATHHKCASGKALVCLFKKFSRNKTSDKKLVGAQMGRRAAGRRISSKSGAGHSITYTFDTVLAPVFSRDWVKGAQQ